AGAAIIQMNSGAWAYSCRHNTCSGKRWPDVRAALGLGQAWSTDLPPSRPEHKATQPGSNGQGPESHAAAGLPVIIVTNRPLRDIIGDAAAALTAANDPPLVYVRAGELTSVRQDEDGRHIIEQLTEGHLRGHLTRSADYFRQKVENITHPETN